MFGGFKTFIFSWFWGPRVGTKPTFVPSWMNVTVVGLDWRTTQRHAGLAVCSVNSCYSLWKRTLRPWKLAIFLARKGSNLPSIFVCKLASGFVSGMGNFQTPLHTPENEGLETKVMKFLEEHLGTNLVIFKKIQPWIFQGVSWWSWLKL